MSRPDIKTLEVFVAVSTIGNMTEAGRRLGMTQSAVSQHISGLERDLGSAVFDRCRRPMSLTAAGRIAHSAARSILDDLNGMRSQLLEQAGRRLPKLRIAMSPGLGPALGKDLYAALMGQVQYLELCTCPTSPEDEVARRAADIAIILGDPEVHDLSVDEAGTLPFVLVRAAGCGPRGLSDLAGAAPCVVFAPETPLARLVQRQFRRLRIAPTVLCETDSVDAMLGIVADCGGWAVLPEICLHPGLSVPEGVTVAPAAELGIRAPLVAIRQQGEHRLIHGCIMRLLKDRGAANVASQPPVPAVSRKRDKPSVSVSARDAARPITRDHAFHGGLAYAKE